MNVAISLAVQAGDRINPGHVPNVLHNILDFTEDASVIVHISSESLLVNGLPKGGEWMSRISRVHINPQQLAVSKHTPAILSAHLSNFLFCDQQGRPCEGREDGRFVLMAQNAVLFRHGLQEWVSRHALSFCIHDRCTDLGCQGNCTSADRELPALYRNLDFLSWDERDEGSGSMATGGSVGGGGTLRQLLREMVPREDTHWVLERDDWYGVFVRWMGTAGSHGQPPAWPGQRTSPINAMPHEGSFYPFWLLRNFVRALRTNSLIGTWALPPPSNSGRPGTGRGEARAACYNFFQKEAEQQVARGIVPKRTARRAITPEGACAFEETLLPTYVWQQYPQLLLNSSPSLVVRVWVTLEKSTRYPKSHSPRSNLDELALRVLRQPSRHPNLFGIKVPHYQFGGASRGLRDSLAPWFRSFADGNRSVRASTSGSKPGRALPSWFASYYKPAGTAALVNRSSRSRHVGYDARGGGSGNRSAQHARTHRAARGSTSNRGA